MTAKEMFDKMLLENDETTSTEMMIEFAKYHVQEALKEAAYYAEIGEVDWDDFHQRPIYGIDETSILNSYNLENIK